MHLWFQKYTFSHEKESCPLSLRPPKSYIFVIWAKKGLKLCIFGLPNTKFSYARGRCPLATPARGPDPWTPVNASRKRSGCSLRSQLIESPMFKIFISLSLGEMYSFVTCKSLVIYIQLKSRGNIAENYNRNWNFISLIWTTIWFHKSHKREQLISILNN